MKKTRSRRDMFHIVLLILLSWTYGGAMSGEIHDAVSKKDANKVNELLAKDPALIKSQDRYGWTPLHWAAIVGDSQMVKILLAKGADPNFDNGYGWTPLHQAQNKEIAEILISNGAKINAGKNDCLPIHKAAWGGMADVVELFISKGISVNAVTRSGDTPLHFAAKYGRIDVVKVLLKYKADSTLKNAKGQTPMDCALAAKKIDANVMEKVARLEAVITLL